MNQFDSTEYICAECNQGGHCNEKDNKCLCGCKFIELRKDAKKYFRDHKEELPGNAMEKYLSNPDTFVERFLNKFQATYEGQYETRTELRGLFSEYLRNSTSNDESQNLNQTETKPKIN